jgi:hypothetical protein
MKSTLSFICLLLLSVSLEAQTISKLTITDNLSSSSKFGYGKPKPAAPKSHFVMMEEKGTQVLFYAELLSEELLPDSYNLVFTAFKDFQGKETWVDERVLGVKKSSGYALTAMNFFETGDYKILITVDNNKDKILAEGKFTIGKE